MNNDEFGRLYRNQFDCVYRYAMALTGNSAHAEEITQEAFARLLRNGLEQSSIVRPEAWLMRVARNLAIERFRERAREKGDLRYAETTSPEQLLYLSEVSQCILQALSRLTESQRDCIALREFGGLSYQEIAGIMSTSIDQVKVQLFRARQHLRKELESLR
jgi:RNA polymerase sigma-70 factor (ECF subfamily)